MVEHSTADREVPGSNPGAPSSSFYRFFHSGVTSTAHIPQHPGMAIVTTILVPVITGRAICALRLLCLFCVIGLGGRALYVGVD